MLVDSVVIKIMMTKDNDNLDDCDAADNGKRGVMTGGLADRF